MSQASLGGDAGTVSALTSPIVSTSHGEATQRPSEQRPSVAFCGPTLAQAAVQDLLHLLLHSLHRLSCLRPQQPGGSPSSTAADPTASPDQQAAADDGFQNEVSLAMFTVQTLLSEVESPAAGVPATRNMTAKGTQTMWPQERCAGTAGPASHRQQAEHATQTKGRKQPHQAAQASQTSAGATDVTSLELEPQCRRADKWKSRCKQTQLDLAAAQSAAAEPGAAAPGREAAHGARSVPEASTSLQPGSSSPTMGAPQQDASQQTEEEGMAPRAACPEQLRAAVSVSDALAATNQELRSALAAQQSDADIERRTLTDQLGAAEARHRQSAGEAAACHASLEGARRQLAALEASLQAERDDSAMWARDLLAEKAKVVALQARLGAETDKLERARVAVLDTVEKLRKVAESASGQAQLVALQRRNVALEAALHEAKDKLARRRSQICALQESHAQAAATLQTSLQAAEATASGLRSQCAEAVASREQSQQQLCRSAAESKHMQAAAGEATRRQERTLQELQSARDALAVISSAAASAAESDGCCARFEVASGSTTSELTQRANDAVSKLTRRCSNLESMLRLIESDRDRAVNEALAVNDTAQRAVEESQTARASEAAALAACEALQATIQELRQQHELERLALSERHAAGMRGLEAAMVESRAVLQQREAEDAAKSLRALQADADAAHAQELAACKAQHAAELETQTAQHAAEMEQAKRELASAASASDSVREHFVRYQAQKAEEVAALRHRLHVVLQQPPRPSRVITSSVTSCGNKLPGQVRRSAQSTAGKHVKAAKPARRVPMRPVVNKADDSIQHSVRGPEPTRTEASSVPTPDRTARMILAALEGDAKAAAVREAEFERTQRQIAEAALAQAMSAVDTLHERVRGLQRELAACRERAVAAGASAAASRDQESSARQQSSQLQVLAFL